MKRFAMLLAVVTSLAVGCQSKEEPAPAKQAETIQQTTAQPKVEEVKPIDFPVPIYSLGKSVKLQDCSEAQKAALQWAYDYFDTQSKHADEKAFYEFMKEKYIKKQYPDWKIPEDIDKPTLAISDYGSDMLPGFTSGQKVKNIVVMPEVTQGLLEVVPMYIMIEGKENYHGVAICYYPKDKSISGASKEFPVPNIEM
ncbi:hypothetical protein P4S91_04585 [Aneurinibacillus aneurinilyticus]|uniref:hypothetical protein n=1 Tax=Aneurinibacillus aneurinilyticus TaxID=1391 RepID=UPI002E1D5FF1|nr:hypothetical protein [Aneurinibacillus aneurinilyticus]MED0722208.1 hypothetical protein [Aneurinibacillus aneurinilyticus]